MFFLRKNCGKKILVLRNLYVAAGKSSCNNDMFMGGLGNSATLQSLLSRYSIPIGRFSLKGL
jgi:hypothetical protein